MDMRRPSQRRPHIILIVLDTHRLDRLGCYGYRRNTSPNIDAFAETATVHESAITPGQWTIPAHASFFTGEPSSTHMTLQGGDVLPTRFPVLAEHLRGVGYGTVAFCNNPLVGVINNGLRRGFQSFYNYGGAAPSVPARPCRPALVPFRWLLERYTQALRRIAYPIQNAFANSGSHFQAALSPFWVPIWTRVAHFKGNTPRSIRDVAHFARQSMRTGSRKPQFVFLNLMETHFPLLAPERFVSEFAPGFLNRAPHRDFMRALNSEGSRWLTPLTEPLPEAGSQILSDMYDAEVAYQDHLLGELLEVLDGPDHRENTLVIIVSDHGEMLGEHRLMGHAFGVYQDLVHVPLIIRYPGQTRGRRVDGPVSATRLFHTALDVAGLEAYETYYGPAVDVASRSLAPRPGGALRPDGAVFCEAVAPGYAVRVAEGYRPEVLDELHCRATHWAVYEGQHKLIRVDGVGDRVYSLDVDPQEGHPITAAFGAERATALGAQLAAFSEKAVSRRPQHWTRSQAKVENELVRQRLRDLGYTE